MNIKCGRIEFEVNSDDVVKYNGACYQLTTRKISKGWHGEIPKIANGKAEKMIKSGQLILDKKEKTPYLAHEIEYYKFNI